MHFHKFITVCFISVLSVSACSTGSSRYYPVETLTPRESTLGFSISPPSGNGWYEKHKDDSLVYLKKLVPSSYSIYTKATEIHLDDSQLPPENIIAYAKSRKRELLTDTRYQNSTFKVSSQQNPALHCIRYQHQYEDHGVKNLSLGSFVQVQDNGILCSHPEAPENGIEMYYQERSLPSTNAVSYREEGESFLASLQFHPPRSH